MNEFQCIRKYFLPLTQGRSEAEALKDDAAVLQVPSGHQLVVTSDTLNAGTHFLPDMAAGDIARKALRVNISDLAAMGADPYAYQLNIAFPEPPDEAWLERFSDALLQDQKTYGLFCSGGDTTRIEGPLSISVTALGLVPEGRALHRAGGRDGDIIAVTGTIGDAVLGLKILQNRENTILSEADQAYLINRYTSPHPRTALVEVMRENVHAAIDVSDGFLADLEHICGASSLSANVYAHQVPLSPSAKRCLDQGNVLLLDLLSGGDDYELILAIPAERFEDLRIAAEKTGVKLTAVGHFKTGEPRIFIFDEHGEAVDIPSKGWMHF